MKIGIFFGGPAREREISFAGGKTAMENIDKTLFTPVPIFVDGLGNFILLDEALVYSPTIRDFYPPKSYQGTYQVYSESLTTMTDAELDEMLVGVGKRLSPSDFKTYFDFAFIAMHGPGCEDGSIQGLLEWYGVPYSGPSVMGSSIGIDKIAQNDLIKLAVGLDKKTTTLSREAFAKEDSAVLFEEIKATVGLPFVVKAPHQGSSIGVAFVKKDDVADFEKAIKQCLFMLEVTAEEWNSTDKEAFVQRMANLDEGIGFPVALGDDLIYHPANLLDKLDIHFNATSENAVLVSNNAEDAVLIEGFVKGQEFSCGVIQTPDGVSVALPPTEIIPAVEVFDFKAKYQSSSTRKKIPIDTTLENLVTVQADVKKAFDSLKLGVCTRIDGFLTPDNRVILHDPNTIPGMSPTSLIFKQMAEIGMNVTDAITYFIRQSIRERIRTGKNTVRFDQLLKSLDAAIAERIVNLATRKKVAIVFGGFDGETKEESYVTARKHYGKLASSSDSLPVPIFVTGTAEAPAWYSLPTNLLFKEFAEDIEKALALEVHPLIEQTRKNAASVTLHFTGALVGAVQITSPATIASTCQELIFCAEGLG